LQRVTLPELEQNPILRAVKHGYDRLIAKEFICPRGGRQNISDK
jgi:hypothetical protein